MVTEVFQSWKRLMEFGAIYSREEPAVDVVDEKQRRSPYGCNRGVGTQELE
jgi:hypothetical protein